MCYGHHDKQRPFLRADFERISLNAMEERVLPPDVRIKIVCAQASAVEQEEELLEANVSARPLSRYLAEEAPRRILGTYA